MPSPCRQFLEVNRRKRVVPARSPQPDSDHVKRNILSPEIAVATIHIHCSIQGDFVWTKML